MTTLIAVGAQWGDEGKGKLVDWLAPQAQLVVRFHGGNNAGHTLVVEGEQTILHVVPAGVLNPGTVNVIGPGVVVDPAILLGEISVILVIATPLGLLVGRGMAAALVASPGFDNEQFRLPLVVGPRTYALAIVTVVLAAAVSAWSAWRKLDRIDIVEVLKSRD